MNYEYDIIFDQVSTKVLESKLVRGSIATSYQHYSTIVDNVYKVITKDNKARLESSFQLDEDQIQDIIERAMIQIHSIPRNN